MVNGTKEAPGHNTFYKEVAQMLSPQFFYTMFALLSCICGLMRTSKWSVDSVKEVSDMVYSCFCRICRCHQNIGSYITKAFFWDIFEIWVLKINLHSKQNFKWWPWLFTLLRKTWSDKLFLYYLLGYSWLISWTVGDLEAKWLKHGKKEI